jgi:HK97 family phage major capsid protein
MSLNSRHDEVVAELRAIADEMTEIGGHEKPTQLQRQRFKTLEIKFADREAEEKSLRLNAIRSAGRIGDGVKTERGYGLSSNDEYDHDPSQGRPRGGGTRDQAMRAIERSAIPAEAQEKAEGLLKQGAPVHQRLAERWITTTGDAAYERAFAYLVADPERGSLMWDDEEKAAFRAVEHLRSETRAMGLTDAQGGYMVPFQLDPTIILTSAGSVNPMRQLAKTVQINSDVWNGITSAGVVANWRPEAQESTDDSPTLTQPTIPVYRGDAFIQFSIEFGMDAVNAMQELGKLLADAADQLHATAFATGTGSGQPFGIVTALTGTASKINTATAGVLVAADVYALQNAQPPRFSPNAQWMAALPIINTLRQFETTAGALKFPELANGNLLGRQMNENSGMAKTLTTGSSVAIYGDFSNYVIVDRFGTTVELVPHIMGANRRPTGQRGLWMCFRTGADSVNDNAFRMLAT